MSVTITINNNQFYIDANHPELIEVHTYGDESFKEYPFQMNLSNSNFIAFFNQLGIESDYCGEIDPTIVLNLLKTLKVRGLVQGDCQEGKFYSMGRTIDQVTRYYWNLSKIAKEAQARNETLIWC